MDIDQFILDCLRERGPLTFSELQEAGCEAGYPMRGDRELGCGRKYFWAGMSEEFAQAVWNLIDRREAKIVPTTQLDCSVSSPRLIVSKQPPIPCRLEAT